MKVLLLAGTSEARAAASLLAAEPDVEVVASLAGRTSQPAAMPCAVRTGGFGDVEGLTAYLRESAVDVIVDATHAFAAVMPHHAARAAAAAGLPCVRLLRPPWVAEPGENWIDATDVADAACVVAELGAARVLLTTGRQVLEPFTRLGDVHFVVRSVEPASIPNGTVVCGRGPFDVADERALLVAHAIDTLVTKNSGGPDGKVVAARELGIRVVMVRRPVSSDVPHVDSPAEALAWVRAQRR